MSFKIDQKENYTLITFSTDKLDAVVAPDLKSELVIMSKNGANNIIIDMGSVKYCDSSGLSALLIGHRVCNEAKGAFILCSLQTPVEKLITISQLDSILTIKSTAKEAIDLVFVEEIGKD